MARSYSEVDSLAINLIGKGTLIKGNIISEGDIRVDGELIGNLKSTARIVIGATGKVIGEISCPDCEISGYFDGKLFIEHLLCLKSSSKVKGEINTAKLSIEPGSVYTGTCAMTEGVKNEKSEPK